MLVKVIIAQTIMGRPLSFEQKIHIFRQRPDFLCLPEYALIGSDIPDFHRAALCGPEQLEYYQHLSDELATCLVGGTVVEAVGDKLYNTAHVIDRGTILGKYRKQYPVPGELAKGISAGLDNLILTVDDLRIGLLICGDVFHSHLYDALGKAGVDIIFVPTTSPYRPDDSLSQKRDRDQRYFVSGAARACGYVAKACGVGQIFGHRLQGRSLIASPWGVSSHAAVHEEDQPRTLIEILDIAEIREFRRKYVERASVGQPTATTDSETRR